MTFLIDTHYVIWAALHSSRMERWVKALLADLNNTVLVSAASVFEIGIKVQTGKLPQAVDFERSLNENIEQLGYTLVDLISSVMLRASRFQAEHGDPFDRMIAAQAIALDAGLLSVDVNMDAFGVRRLIGT